MTARYRLDPGHGRFTVQAFATGMLSFMGHNPTFAVRDYRGEMRFDPASPDGTAVEVAVRADSLELLDKVRPADRDEIEGRMRREVLETSAYPEIRYEASEALSGSARDHQYQVRLGGALTLLGVTARHAVDLAVHLYNDGARVGGETGLRLSEFGIRPVTALAGTLRLRDEVRVSFDLVAWKEES
jgi:polyisoprenoid-binding protein YceI